VKKELSHSRLLRSVVVSSLALSLAVTASCQIVTGANPVLENQDIRLTILHTSDFHSRLVPYVFSPGLTDQDLGLDEDLSAARGVGGIERLAYLVARERARSARSIHLDSGDCFQGAPIFNLYNGEAEMRTMSELRIDAAVVGNHEFDQGATNYATQVERWKTFPLLASNYIFEDDTKPWNNTLNRNIDPFTILNVEGLRVGVIGLGNLSSLTGLTEQGNSLGIIATDTIQTAQIMVNEIRPMVDLVVLVTHMGVREDEEIARNVTGIDVIMGGHLHIVLNPPETVKDPDGREVIIAHSGAFLKYMGRLDLVVHKSETDPENGFEVLSFRYKVFPIDARVDDEVFTEVDKDEAELAGVDAWVRMHEIMEPYLQGIAEKLDLRRTVGCSEEENLRRFGSGGGDSPLGNLVAEAMQLEPRVQTDFAVTNSAGIRDDLRGRRLDQPTDDPARRCTNADGDVIHSVDAESLFNVLPFENTISTMFLAGTEIQELLDYNADRSAGRGCQSQLQVSGISFKMVCRGDEHGDFPHADDVEIGGIPLNFHSTYELATNDYIAQGGSGFEVLKRNTTQQNTSIPMRDAVVAYLQELGVIPCVDGSDPDLDPGDDYPDCPGAVYAAGVEDGRITAQF
jgi:5'-nucleotidase / UDP-sugar diphosphatase